MLTLEKLYSIIDEYAPFEISKKLIEEGEYDNSGILINSHQEIKKVLFALDLSLTLLLKQRCLSAIR